jgi:hypothetical protein
MKFVEKREYGTETHDRILSPVPQLSPVSFTSSLLTYLIIPANCAHRKEKNAKETTAKEEIGKENERYRKKENES